MKNKKYDYGLISYNINTKDANFGAALHSFAFQKFLDKLNIDNVIIDYEADSFYKIFKKTNKSKSLLRVPLIFLVLCYKRFLIRNFFRKYCRVTKNKYTAKTIQNINSIKYFCCETDVTWTKYLGEYDRAFLCDYPNMKTNGNIAYSVDFGQGEINSEKAENLHKYAQNFKYISIRNVFRLEDFKRVTQRDDVIVTIDPTLLLSEKDYLPVIKHKKKRKDFILVYNCKEDNQIMVEKAKNFAKENNLAIKIVNCYDAKVKNKWGAIQTPIGLEEFLWNLKNCSYFFTNSYHGICFSIIFKKQFYAFDRIANSEKIRTILTLFNLQNRLTTTDLIKENIDYEKVYDLLQKHREESINWIKIAFEVM